MSFFRKYFLNELQSNQRLLIIDFMLIICCLLAFFPLNSSASIFGEDSRKDPICFSNDMANRARAVARLNVSGSICTAFLISPENHVLTSFHCIDQAPPNWSGELHFDLVASACNEGPTGDTSIPLTSNDVIRSNPVLDYVLFQLDYQTEPDSDVAINNGTHGWLPLDPDTRLIDLSDQETGLFILAYNDDTGKIMYSWDQECRIDEPKMDCVIQNIANPPEDACMSQHCDTISSNSGAPIFLVKEYMYPSVIAINYGGERQVRLWWPDSYYNQGVKIRRIYEEIKQFLPYMGDADRDGMPNVRDNCPDVPNTGVCMAGIEGKNCLGDRDCDTTVGQLDGICEGSQIDTDGDGVGDPCSTLPKDIFEPNDLAVDAGNLTSGSYDLTIHDRHDTDFFTITTPHSTDNFTVFALYSTPGRELAKSITYRDCDTCPYAFASGELSFSNSGWRYQEDGIIPDGRTYLFELYESNLSGPMDYTLHVVSGDEVLPEDPREPNNTPTQSYDYLDGGCDFTGLINIHNGSDVDYYKIDADGYSVETEITFNPSQGNLDLFLNDIQATDAITSADGTKITLRITGCGQSPSYVRILGEPNFYTFCIRRIPLQTACSGYVPYTPFAGSGTFTYLARPLFGPLTEVTGNVRRQMYARVQGETASNVMWSIAGWIDYAPGLSQGFIASLEIPRPTGTSPAAFTAHVLDASNMRKWFQIEGQCTAGNVDALNCLLDEHCDTAYRSGDGVCAPIKVGSASYEGPDNSMVSFTATSGVNGMFWSVDRPDERGTLIIEAYGIDLDGDGILSQIELATETDPNSDDTDGDGIPDGKEDANQNGFIDYLFEETDPRVWDTDGDGLSDGVERGLTSPEANDTDMDIFLSDLDPSTTTNPTIRDTDGDGCEDGNEDANKDGKVDWLIGETSPIVKETDSDGDCTPDNIDSCPSDPENDFDNDSVCGEVDNCPYIPNGPNSGTCIEGRIGKWCSDLYLLKCSYLCEERYNRCLVECGTPSPPVNPSEECLLLCTPFLVNCQNNCDEYSGCGEDGICSMDQEDLDSNGLGDACEIDTDGDGLPNAIDPCPGSPDCDGDGLSDSKEDANQNGVVDNRETDPNDPDTDDDSLNDGEERALWGDEWNNDTDHDGTINILDPDADGDEVLDNQDNCRNAYNPDLLDSDNDGSGDMCDSDVTAARIITNSEGYLVTDNCAIKVPEGTVDTDTTFSIAGNENNYQLGTGTGDAQAVIGVHLASGVQNFAQPVTIRFHWQNEQLPAEVMENELFIVREANIITSSCSQIDDSYACSCIDFCINCKCDLAENFFEIDVSSFSEYAVAAPLDSDGDDMPDNFNGIKDNCLFRHNPDQEDTYPPGGNGCGDACECEGDFDHDSDQDGSDAAKFKEEFGRSSSFDPCTQTNSCTGNFDSDQDVDGMDAVKFKEDFGRSIYHDVCPICAVAP